MYYYKNKLKRKEIFPLFLAINELEDRYNDFYIVKDSKRFSIKENFILLLSSLSKGNSIIYNDNFNVILIIIKIGDKNYLKVLYKDIKDVDEGLKFLFWNYKKDLFAELNNKEVIDLLVNKFNFRFFSKEILMRRKYYDR